MNQKSERQNQKDANRDPITGAPQSHPVGTGVGAAAGGAATGAAIGSVAGPVGTAAGIIGGAIVGGLAGKGVAEAINPTAEDAYWRENHPRQSFAAGRAYSDYQGAYRTGYTGYSKYGARGRDFDQCEVDLQRDYEQNRGVSTLGWSEAKHAARAAWQKLDTWHERLVGYEVQDQNGTKIGTVSHLWVDENNQPAFLAVKTGWLGLGKSHVVPVHTSEVNEQQRVIRVPYLEAQIKDAPTFDETVELARRDEETIYRYYGIQRPVLRSSLSPDACVPPPPRASEVKSTGVARNVAEYRDVQESKPNRETQKNREGATVRLSQEELKVGKREVEAGGVWLRKIVRTETVNQPVELRREEIVIERVPGTGAATAPGTECFTSEDVFIPLRREEAVIEKQSRVVEEIRVSKKTETDRQTVSEQVRKEEIKIDQEGAACKTSEPPKPKAKVR